MARIATFLIIGSSRPAIPDDEASNVSSNEYEAPAPPPPEKIKSEKKSKREPVEEAEPLAVESDGGQDDEDEEVPEDEFAPAISLEICPNNILYIDMLLRKSPITSSMKMLVFLHIRLQHEC